MINFVIISLKYQTKFSETKKFVLKEISLSLSNKLPIPCKTKTVVKQESFSSLYLHVGSL